MSCKPNRLLLRMLTLFLLAALHLLSIRALAEPRRTIWLIEMPHEPAKSYREPDLDSRIKRLLNAGDTGYLMSETGSEKPLLIPQGCIVNTYSELKQDPDFANAVLGQKDTFNIVRQFAKSAQDQGYAVRLRFLPWSRALREIERRNQEYVVEGGDVMITQIPSSWCSYLISKQILTNLVDMIDRSQFRDSTLRWYTWNHGIYAVPYLVDMRFLFYNKAKYRDEDFLSEEKFLAALKREKYKDTRQNYFPIGVPTAVGFNSFHLLANLFVDGGESELVRQTDYKLFTWTDANLNSKPAQHVVDLLARMRWLGYLDAPAISDDEAAKRFIKGNYDMVLLGAWVTSYYDDPPASISKPSFPLGIALPPDLGNGRHVFEGGSGFGLCARKDADPRAAQICREFIQSQARRNPRNELPATTTVQSQSLLFQRVTQAAGWKQENSFTYPIVAAWAPALEQQPISDLFWTELNNLTPSSDSQNAADQQRLKDTQAVLHSRMRFINDDINNQLTPGDMHRLGMPGSAIVLFGLTSASGASAAIVARKLRKRLEDAENKKKAAEVEAELLRGTARLREAEQQLAVADAEQQRQEFLRETAELNHKLTTMLYEAHQQAAGMAAHRLRGALSAADNYITWIIQKRYSQPEVNAEVVADASEEIARAIRIINEFLEFAKIGDYPLCDRIRGDLLLHELAGDVKSVIGRPDVSLETHAEEKLPDVQVNRDRLRDDFINFSHNAQRFVPGHLHIRLSVCRATPAEIFSTKLLPDTEYLKFVCEDDGPGVPPELKEWIFGFFNTKGPDGNGLGLAICRMDMQCHGGAVVERGEYGKGARFELYLPVCQPGNLGDHNTKVTRGDDGGEK